ncbi:MULTISPECIES: type VI secretion system baseplate subunit TssG [unclassified Bradyrhizobium]|uniref:type VI secretion system baseplate subunit TssG n=1 Tax=unclassified Bradyrhizobium TaxID=2631580 RepID=UPI0024786DC6|nr:MULTISPECIES: type VI secretion system baseplate subunit TssG [unclassified Bradyrhizobium]WGR72802.1 type VI secretion system baseplate subunit TssG [Bradyrhizobium sp. ISRA426]WGR77637.1 type VI secretion system baseplate subunit TssG [Bradyrhizobium sp. ISRA430]WGR88042.1 type VI secretion system baseplate subunit TssG [Bradyrhizobium sp. ISRA432]
MASEKRIDHGTLTAPDERDELSAFGFFSLVAHLERRFSAAPPIGSTDDPAREAVRFRAAPTLGFPAEEIAEVRQVKAGTERVEVNVNFLGLHGPSSPLPPFYAERVMHAEGMGSLRDFFDFFNHRLISLLLRIWRYYRHHLRFEEGATDAISVLIGTLFGLVPREGTADEREWRARLLPHAGVLALCSRSAKLVAGLISSHLNISARVEEFIWREIDIPRQAQWHLGRAGLELGVDTLAGETMPDIVGKFRLCLGPLNQQQFRSLLPGCESHAIVCRLVNVILREPLAWDLQLELALGQTPEWTLGEGELGWTTWIDPPNGTGSLVLL